MTVELRGITWGHERGVDPLTATAARYADETGVRVSWDVRSLQGFADAQGVQGIAHSHQGGPGGLPPGLTIKKSHRRRASAASNGPCPLRGGDDLQLRP